MINNFNRNKNLFLNKTGDSQARSFKFINIFQNTGFTFVEVIIVIAVVMIGLIGIVSLVRQNTRVQDINKNFLIASMLSQEGLELVRNKRDTNWVTAPQVDWLTGQGVGTQTDIIQDNNYIIDYTNGGTINSSVSSIDDPGAKLYINNTTGFYTHDPGVSPNKNQETPFRRIITIGNVDNTKYVEVNCEVKWTDRGQTHNYISSTYLYNWR